MSLTRIIGGDSLNVALSFAPLLLCLRSRSLVLRFRGFVPVRVLCLSPPRPCPRSRSLFHLLPPLSAFVKMVPPLLQLLPLSVPHLSAVLLLLCCLTRILGDLFNLARSCALLLLCLRSRSLVLRFRAVVPVRVLCLSPPRPCPRSRSLFHLLLPLSLFVEKVPLLLLLVPLLYLTLPQSCCSSVATCPLPHPFLQVPPLLLLSKTLAILFLHLLFLAYVFVLLLSPLFLLSLSFFLFTLSFFLFTLPRSRISCPL